MRQISQSLLFVHITPVTTTPRPKPLLSTAQSNLFLDHDTLANHHHPLPLPLPFPTSPALTYCTIPALKAKNPTSPATTPKTHRP